MGDGALKITSADVRAALRLRYPLGEHALLFEVANGTGGNGRVYADAVAVGLWPSHGHKVEGIEVKVSRSDFLSEMKNASKSDPVFRYCDHWWLACPKGMVKPDELPPTWGLLELIGDTLRIRHKAPKLEPEAMPRTFVASLMRRHAGADEEMAAITLRRELERGRREYQDRIDREAQHRYRSEVEDAKRANATWELVLKQTGIDLRRMHDSRDFCQAVALVQSLGSGWNAALRTAMDSAVRVSKEIAESGLLHTPPTTKPAGEPQP